MPRPLALHPDRLFPADPQGKCANPAGTVSVGCISVLSDAIDPAGVMTAGTFSGVDTRVEDRFDSMHTNFTQVTSNGTHDLSDKRSVDELVGYFESRFNGETVTSKNAYSGLLAVPLGSYAQTLNFVRGTVSVLRPRREAFRPEVRCRSRFFRPPIPT